MQKFIKGALHQQISDRALFLDITEEGNTELQIVVWGKPNLVLIPDPNGVVTGSKKKHVEDRTIIRICNVSGNKKLLRTL